MKPSELLFCLLLSAGRGVYASPWPFLNATLGGRLKVATPLALPCFTSYGGKPNTVDEPSCATVRAGWRMNDLRVSTPGSYMNLQSEMCLSDPADQCLVNNTVSPAGMPSSNSTCNQGSVPSYYIQVTGAEDVTAAFKFVEEHGVRLTIKNSGHDYMTRNSGKGSLSLWTHHLQDIAYHKSFVPQGCKENVGAAMTVGVGVDGNTAHYFADAHDSMIIGPYSPTVTVSAGWVLGGGHGVLAPVYGLGVDRVVEFHIVTPDGAERIVNACQDPDLFWALRGGGGGTFGVVLSATHRVEPRIPLAFADIHLPPNTTSDTAIEWIRILVEESLDWGDAGWGGHVGGTFVTHFNPLPALTRDNGTAARAAFKRASDFALARGGTANVAVYSSWLEIWERFLLPLDSEQGGNLGMGSSRLLPPELFATPDGQARILDYIRYAQTLGFDPVSFYTPVTTPFTHGRVKNSTSSSSSSSSEFEAGRNTSVHPAWYRSLWHLQTIGTAAWDSTYGARLAFLMNLTRATRAAEALAGPRAGTHFNEANPFAAGWRESYWGRPHYERLVGIKRAYDPAALLKCWKCVGFEDADVRAERFACQGRLQADVDRALA